MRGISLACQPQKFKSIYLAEMSGSQEQNIVCLLSFEGRSAKTKDIQVA